MKKFLLLLSVLVFTSYQTMTAATPPVPTSTDDLIKQYKEQKPASPQQKPAQPQAAPQTKQPTQQPTQPSNKGPLSIEKLEEKLEKAVDCIKANNFVKAEQILGSLTVWLTDSTEYHILLLNTLKDLPDAQYQTEIERAFAVKSALLRDKALFYYGAALMGNQKDEEAARNFILVVQSQPKSKLGFDAYTRLQMLGFTQKVQFQNLEDVEK